MYRTFHLPNDVEQAAMVVRCRLMADIVAKVFLGGRTKFLRAADAFYERRREGPYRFIQIDQGPP